MEILNFESDKFYVKIVQKFLVPATEICDLLVTKQN